MIYVKELVKYFNLGSVNQVTALKGIDLTVDRGDFITVIGSNGAGKSTLLNCLAGTYSFERGSLCLDDTDITSWPEHQRARYIGRVFQDPLMGTCGSLSIEQNLAMASRRGEARGFSIGVKSRDRDRFRRELEKLKLGLEDRLGDAVGLLSGGQRQALTLLMATLVHPEILLLDEHTAALDPKTAHRILTLTEEMIGEGNLTTLMVTHNMKQALSLGNRLIMLHGGRVILDVKGEEKRSLTVDDLLAKFYESSGEDLASDRMLLG